MGASWSRMGEKMCSHQRGEFRSCTFPRTIPGSVLLTRTASKARSASFCPRSAFYHPDDIFACETSSWTSAKFSCVFPGSAAIDGNRDFQILRDSSDATTVGRVQSPKCAEAHTSYCMLRAKGRHRTIAWKLSAEHIDLVLSGASLEPCAHAYNPCRG